MVGPMSKKTHLFKLYVVAACAVALNLQVQSTVAAPTLPTAAPSVETEDPAVPTDDSRRVALRQQIEQVVTTTKTARFEQDALEWMGDENERAAGTLLWKGPDHIRIETREGRAAGSTAVLNGDKVIAWFNALSFIKPSYDWNSKTVLSLRGNSMKDAGFLDDFAAIFDTWERVTTDFSGPNPKLQYKDAKGLDVTVTLNGADPVGVAQIETHEGGRLVGRLTVRKIEYNPPLDDKLFNP